MEKSNKNTATPEELFARGKACYDNGDFAGARKHWTAAAKAGDENARMALTWIPDPDFEIKDGTLAKYKGKGGKVVIPYGVTRIGDKVFDGCGGLTGVAIPNSVTSIEDRAFACCENLTSVMMSNSITNIGSGAFFRCRKLASIIIPNGVTSIGGSAFEDCSGLTSITIPNSVISIGNYAFEYCDRLTSIEVESGNGKYHSVCNCLIETATKTLIAGCKNSLIPSDGSVTSIGCSAFRGCSGLTSIIIPDSVTSIGGGAFMDCSGLMSITIPNGVTSIGGGAFSNCSGLTSVSVLSGNKIFHSICNCLIKTETKTLILGCKNSVIPPDGSVTSIDSYAFYGCSGLTSITIPNIVTSIEWYTFARCRGLTTIEIPNSVTSIKAFAFENCSRLTSITIPNSVTRIEGCAFGGCSSLTDIYCDEDSKPDGWDDDWLGDCKATVHWGYDDGAICKQKEKS